MDFTRPTFHVAASAAVENLGLGTRLKYTWVQWSKVHMGVYGASGWGQCVVVVGVVARKSYSGGCGKRCSQVIPLTAAAM